MLINLTCASPSNCLVPSNRAQTACALAAPSTQPSTFCVLCSLARHPGYIVGMMWTIIILPPPDSSQTRETQSEKQVKSTLSCGVDGVPRCGQDSEGYKYSNHALAPRLIAV